MNEKAASAQQKALQERKRGNFDKAVKRLEQTIAQFPDELDLYLDAVDACLEGGEVMQATNFLKTAQERFPKDKDRVGQFVRDKLLAVHDPALARYVVENAVKRRDLENALEHLEQIPDHVARDLLARTKTKKQSLKSASGGGHSLRSEMFTNDLLSALLSIRLGSMKEGMTAIVQIIDEKPIETKMLQPFLAGLESKHPKTGRIRFAHACALWVGGNEVDAIARLVECARFDPTAHAMCADRLQMLREKTKFRGKVERALAEVLLLQGDFDGAATVLRGYLAANKDAGREVIMILKPFLDPAHGLNECVWVALDAALALEQSAVAMEILRPLHTRGNCTPDLYARLEARSKDGLLATEIMMFHAAIALELKDFPRASEILHAVVATSPQDAHAVVGLADKHRTMHAGLEELCRKHMEPEPAEPLAGEGEDFQNFDHNEFSLRRDAKADGIERSSSSAPPSTPKPAAEKPASRFAEDRRKPEEKQSFIETRELSFDDEGTPASEAAGESAENAAGDLDTDGFEIASDMRLSPARTEKPMMPQVAKPADKPAEKPAAPVAGAVPIAAPSQARHALKMRPAAEVAATESHVLNVARRLEEVGASAFFHIDGSENEEAHMPEIGDIVPAREEATASRAPIDAVYHANPAPAPTPAPAPEPVAAEPSVIERLEAAAEHARVDELHDLLAFEPKDDVERFAQRFYEAEFHTLSNRPLPALEILEKLGNSALNDEQKQRVWFKIAVCQRSMNDFAGANDTLKRLVDAFPGCAEYDRLARRNQEQFLGEQANDVAVLQKTTSLD